VNVLYYPKRRDKPITTSPVKCSVCSGTRISKNGKEGAKQRYLCGDKGCPGKSFVLEYTCNGWKPGINEQIITMAANASGIWDTARVLKVSEQKVGDTLKKTEKTTSRVNLRYIAGAVEAEMILWERVEAAELDEMWSFVGNKGCQRAGHRPQDARRACLRLRSEKGQGLQGA
jgi:transposase-like protein